MKKKYIIFDIFAIILIVIFAVSLSPKGLQNDTFYTIKIGELITQNGVDMQEHFSWHQGLPYTYPHWLYDVSMYLIYNIAGWTGIYLSTCIFAAILGICIYEVNAKLSKNNIIAFFVTLGSLYLLKGYIAARAQLITFILFILLIYNIEKFIENKKIINAIFILIIHTLIANLHVAVWPFTFVLYLPYIAEYFVCIISEIVLYKKIKLNSLKRKIKKYTKKNSEKLQDYQQKMDKLLIKVEKIKEKRSQNLKEPYKIIIEKKDNVKWLIIVMLFALFTGLLTPLGKVPYTYTILTFMGNTMKSISEHLPLTLINSIPTVCAIIIVLGALTFTKAKIKLCDLFMISGLAFLMFKTRRQISMFALIGSVGLSRIIVNMVEEYIKEDISEFINKFTISVVSILVIVTCFSISSKTKKGNFINENTYPVKTAEWILENLDINNIKLYNEYNYGSYLLFKGIPVFIDSRADLYAPEFNRKEDIFSDFIDCSNLGKYYGDIFKKYQITHVMVYKNSKINMLIEKADSEKYKLIYPIDGDKSKDNFVIYEVLEY